MTDGAVAKRSTVVVLDSEDHGGRRLVETVTAVGFEVASVTRLEDLGPAVSEQGALVAAVAFEALWPDPQRTLRRLREETPGVRLVVVYSEESRRLRLGQRLWAIGLFDYFMPREAPPHQMAPVLRQAYADALIEGAAEEDDEGGEDTRLNRRLRFLHGLGAAFTSQRNVDGLVRELQMRLPHFIDYNVLGVLVAGDDNAQLHVWQTRPMEHHVLWGLAERICDSVAPFSESPLTPEQLTFVGAAPLSGSGEDDSSTDLVASEHAVTVPMVVCGQLVGCIGLLAPSHASMTHERVTILQVVAYHLGTAIRNAQIVEKAESASLVDELTGAYNRRYLARVLSTEWNRTQRYNSPLSAAMLDLDHFKRINDVHGHLIGDEVLRTLVSMVRAQLRDTDHMVRYGGEEFLLLLPETGPTEATLVVERLRFLLARKPVYTGSGAEPLMVTFSAGIAATPMCGARDAEELVDLADAALLAAKRSGRDRICMASEQSFDELDEGDGEGDGRGKRFRKVGAGLKVRYVELPLFEGRAMEMDTTDVSPSGIAVRGGGPHLKKNAYALVYIGDEDKPVLSRVEWTKEGDGTRSAGLRFVAARDLGDRPFEPAENPKAVVVSELPRTRAQVQRVLRAAKYDTQFYGAGDEIDPQTVAGCSLFVVGQSSLRGALGEQLQALRKKLTPSVRFVVINEIPDRRAALDTIRSEGVEHLVPGDAGAEEALFATLNKLLLGEYFGIKKYLLWGTVTKSWGLTRSEEKARVLDGIKSVAEEVGCHPRIIDLLVAAVDEMIINALYRPHDDAHASKPVTVECGSDGRLLAVGVLDEHGMFRHEDMLRGIGAALEHEKHGLPDDATHAHLGFRIMLGALSQVVVNVDPGRCTEIIGIIDLRKSLRAHRASVPGVGLFEKGR